MDLEGVGKRHRETIQTTSAGNAIKNTLERVHQAYRRNSSVARFLLNEIGWNGLEFQIREEYNDSIAIAMLSAKKSHVVVLKGQVDHNNEAKEKFKFAYAKEDGELSVSYAEEAARARTDTKPTIRSLSKMLFGEKPNLLMREVCLITSDSTWKPKESERLPYEQLLVLIRGEKIAGNLNKAMDIVGFPKVVAGKK